MNSANLFKKKVAEWQLNNIQSRYRKKLKYLQFGKETKRTEVIQEEPIRCLL